jgi:hypothetical protein
VEYKEINRLVEVSIKNAEIKLPGKLNLYFRIYTKDELVFG